MKPHEPMSVYYEGETPLPVEKRFKKGDTVWVIADPPGEVEVLEDTGHPRWLKTTSWGPEDQMVHHSLRSELRKSEKNAARAMLASYRQEAKALLKQAERLARKYDLPLSS